MTFSAQDIKKLREKTGAGMMDCKKAIQETGDIEKAVDWLRKKGINTAQKKSARSATDGLITVEIDNNVGVIMEINSETDFVAKNEIFLNFCEALSKHCILNKISKVDQLLESIIDNSKSKVKDELTNIIAKLGENIVIKRLNLINQTDLFLQKYIHNSVSDNSGKLGVILCYKSSKNDPNIKEISKQISMHIAATDPKSLDIESLDQSLIEKEREIFRDQLKSTNKPPDIIEKIIEGKIKKIYDEVCLLEQFFVMDNKVKVKDYISNFNKSNDLKFSIEEYFVYKLGA